MTDSFFNIPVPDYLSVLMQRDADEIQAIIAKLPQEQQDKITRRLIDLVAHKQTQIDGMMAIGSAFSRALRTEELLQEIMEKITVLMNAERSTLFIHDMEKNELWSVISQGLGREKIQLKVGEGIAGWVAEKGESLNLCDVYAHEKFKKSVDTATGFQTKTMLCQPVVNAEKEIIGVVQVLNRKEGEFDQEDEYLLAAICGQVSIALENSKLYTDIVDKNEALTKISNQLEEHVAELDLLVEVERIATRSVDTDTMISALIQKTCDVFKASAVFLTLSDPSLSCVYQYVPSFDSPSLKIPLGDKNENAVIRSGQSMVCQADAVSNSLISDLPFEISSMIGVPLFDENEERCIGAIQAVHSSLSTLEFTEDELKILGLIASRVVTILYAQFQREEMEKSNRMAVMGKMLSGIIHDIKNPISVISGYVQLMERNEDREKRKAFALTIKKQFGLLNRMTVELLDYAKGQTNLLRRKLYLADFFDSFDEILATELSARGVELEVNLEYRGILIVDESKLQRAILNLARNAAHAMPDGGKFTILVKEEGDEVVFVFQDTGAGIPVEVRERLFDEFVTAGKKNGTGLGLSIVKHVVEEHKGTISFESVLNKGTTFTIRLPKGIE